MKHQTSTAYFHSAGWAFMALFAGVTCVLAAISFKLFFIGFILTAWCFYFFRNPDRVTPNRDGLIVSPADGRVILIQHVVPDVEFGLGTEPRTRISIFLNVFNVHVNRMPVSGTVITRSYRPGKFFNASLDKASVDNERMALTVQMDGHHPKSGEKIAVVQIAGLIARRIVCDAQEGDACLAGNRFGIIRFGSRTDVYLPSGVAPLVCVGQIALGGETILADCTAVEPARIGEKRP